MRTLVALLVLASGLAGCATEPAAPACEPRPVAAISAFDFTAGLVTTDAGEPRFRVPGTTGHFEGACWLYSASQASGWNVAFENFTGDQFLDLEAGAVAGYVDCTPDERARLQSLRFSNIVATREGDGSDPRTLVMGAHWESKRYASEDAEHPMAPVLGANDGASGVGVLLALQRGLPPLPYDVRIVFFDGEDGFEDCHPLAGSLYHAQNYPEGPGDRMLLLDMVGDADARFPREQRSYRADPALQDLIWEQAHAAGRGENFLEVLRPVYDDHVPFIEQGVPAVDVVDFGRPDGGFPPYWHTTEDTLERLDPVFMEDMADIVLATLTDARFTAEWPQAS